jgi:hypothetical protein
MAQLVAVSSHEGQLRHVSLDMDERHYRVALTPHPRLFDARVPIRPATTKSGSPRRTWWRVRTSRGAGGSLPC